MKKRKGSRLFNKLQPIYLKYPAACDPHLPINQKEIKRSKSAPDKVKMF
jgi:hypothetical protein